MCDTKRECRHAVMADGSFNKKLQCSEERNDGWILLVSQLDLLLKSILHFKSLAFCQVTEEDKPVCVETNLNSRFGPSEELQHVF
ncbi:hypothetical protein Baya_16464 [Bagarius yarrelli]|uniref:Uncharacterized protein n=1 Tax=Bagarius yarrelli TaxID=175774 RepID=A0A556VVT4_BAGYA|nr:hypothetical protein Baya_16464 [Bagarius yarrelli]